MRVVYLSFVFLFAREIQNLHSPATNFRKIWENSAKSSSSDLSPQSLFDLNFNPCDGRKIQSGAPNAQSACQNECQAVNAEISTIYNAFSDYKTIQFLYDKCGMVSEGRCSTGDRNSMQRTKHSLLQLDKINNIAANTPVCWCNTPKESKEHRKIILSVCRDGIKIMRKFTNAVTSMSRKTLANSTENRTIYQEMGGKVEAVGTYQPSSVRPPTRSRRGNRHRPNTRLSSNTSGAGPSVPPPPLPQQEEEDWNSRPDGQPEGMCLVTDVRVSGRDVRAFLDTGAEYSLIHPSFASSMTPVGNQCLSNESGQKIIYFGKTTINLEIRRGISIPLTGCVTDRLFAIVLGTNFFVEYAAKVRILDRKMDIVTGQTTKTMTIKFRAPGAGPNPASILPPMTNNPCTPNPEYTGLQIVVRVNTIATRMLIDTGSSVTIVNKSFVNQQNIQPVAVPISILGNSPVAFKGSTDVNLQIGSNGFSLPALVPDFKPAHNFLTGNRFNKVFVEIIDYESRSVTFRYPDSVKIKVPAIIMKDQ